MQARHQQHINETPDEQIFLVRLPPQPKLYPIFVIFSGKPMGVVNELTHLVQDPTGYCQYVRRR